MSEEKFTFEFATRDDCLDKMVPSDLRGIIAERDRLRVDKAGLVEALEKIYDKTVALTPCLDAIADDGGEDADDPLDAVKYIAYYATFIGKDANSASS